MFTGIRGEISQATAFSKQQSTTKERLDLERKYKTNINKTEPQKTPSLKNDLPEKSNQRTNQKL